MLWHEMINLVLTRYFNLIIDFVYVMRCMPMSDRACLLLLSRKISVMSATVPLFICFFLIYDKCQYKNFNEYMYA